MIGIYRIYPLFIELSTIKCRGLKFCLMRIPVSQPVQKDDKGL